MKIKPEDRLEYERLKLEKERLRLERELAEKPAPVVIPVQPAAPTFRADGAELDTRLGSVLRALTGPQGVVGPQGDRGLQGVPGVDGIDGAVGLPGIDGQDGERGFDGAQGPAGPIGPQGPQGDPGPEGPKGEQGEKGEKGERGPPGPGGGGHVFSGAAYFGLSDALPLPGGTASAGVSGVASRADHVHEGAAPDLSDYLTLEDADATFESQTHAAATYQTQAAGETAAHAAATYATLASNSGTSSGTNTGDVTIGTANGLSRSGQVLSMATAVAAGANGALLGTDKTKLDATSGTNSGDVTLAAVGSSPNANGATLSGQALNLEAANGSFPGVVTTAAQTFAGVKTFSSAPTLSAGATIGTLTSVSWGGAAALQNGLGQYTGMCRALPDGGNWPFPCTRFHTGTAGSNTSTGETTLQQDAHLHQVGNVMDVAGRGWHVRAWGTFAANGNTKTIKLKFGPTQTDVTAGAFTGAFNGGGWYLEAIILRSTGTSAQTVVVNYGTTSASPVTVIGKVSAPTEATATNDWAMTLTGTGGATSDIANAFMRIDFLP